ncbi:MAG: radical SAM protein [Deltaproteobacteria bacterium]|nr:radical SAM protein [Deltaproteobacteria bacterium]
MGVPRYLYLTVTRECNLRCRQCHFWTYKDPEDKLTVSELKNVIDQFHNLNPEGIVVINGGEPTIHREDFFEICRYLREKNLKSACVTNGYDFDERICARLIKEGPTYITVSLDSHLPEIHNRLRGKSDAFEKTLGTIRRLVEFKNNATDTATEITVTTIIFDENIRHLADYVEFVRTLGVRGVLFQIINPTFANVSKEDRFFDEHFFKDKDEAIRIIDSVYQRYRDDPFVFLSGSDAEWFKSYIKNPNFTGETVCDSHNKNIFIELQGDIVLCAHMRNFNNGQAIGNVRQKSLSDILNSEVAARMRSVMKNCRKNCGLLACHKRES